MFVLSFLIFFCPIKMNKQISHKQIIQKETHSLQRVFSTKATRHITLIMNCQSFHFVSLFD